MSWDERYAIDDWLFGKEPSPFIVDNIGLLKPGGEVLAIGDGEGRNGVWLASQGMRVTSVDISQNAIDKAQRLARERHVELETICADLTQWDWPIRKFDAVISIFVHFAPENRDRLHAHMISALRPEGILLMEAFHIKQLEYGDAGPRDPAMLYDEQQIKAAFEPLKTLFVHGQETRVFKHAEPEENGYSVQYAGRRILID